MHLFQPLFKGDQFIAKYTPDPPNSVGYSRPAQCHLHPGGILLHYPGFDLDGVQDALNEADLTPTTYYHGNALANACSLWVKWTKGGYDLVECPAPCATGRMWLTAHGGRALWCLRQEQFTGKHQRRAQALHPPCEEFMEWVAKGVGGADRIAGVVCADTFIPADGLRLGVWQKPSSDQSVDAAWKQEPAKSATTWVFKLEDALLEEELYDSVPGGEDDDPLSTQYCATTNPLLFVPKVMYLLRHGTTASVLPPNGIGNVQVIAQGGFLGRGSRLYLGTYPNQAAAEEVAERVRALTSAQAVMDFRQNYFDTKERRFPKFDNDVHIRVIVEDEDQEIYKVMQHSTPRATTYTVPEIFLDEESAIAAARAQAQSPYIPPVKPVGHTTTKSKLPNNVYVVKTGGGKKKFMALQQFMKNNRIIAQRRAPPLGTCFDTYEEAFTAGQVLSKEKWDHEAGAWVVDERLL